jgi:hypothetical protein
MPGDIHFIERLGDIKRIDKESAIWESGWWAVVQETAEKLIGGRIFFHKAQDKPSFFGGTVTSYRVETEGALAGRLIFTFTFSPEFRGVRAGRDGWGMEKKVVLSRFS